jgi:hypothetical protein
MDPAQPRRFEKRTNTQPHAVQGECRGPESVGKWISALDSPRDGQEEKAVRRKKAAPKSVGLSTAEVRKTW